MMRLAPNMPGPGVPFWLPYFGVDGIDAAVARIKEAGGKVVNGPHDVPGGAFIVVGQDPQGAISRWSGRSSARQRPAFAPPQRSTSSLAWR